MKPRVGRARTLVFTLFLLLVVYAVVEGGAYVAYWIIFREPLSLTALRQERHQIQSSGWHRPRDLARRLRREAIHPFLGYVRNPEVRVRFGPHIDAYGFLSAPPPIQQRTPGKIIVAIVGGSVAKNFAAFAADRAPTLSSAL